LATILPNCTNYNNTTSTFMTVEEYCAYDYSYLVVYGEYFSLLKQLF
jgi:hypothetical protein